MMSSKVVCKQHVHNSPHWQQLDIDHGIHQLSCLRGPASSGRGWLFVFLFLLSVNSYQARRKKAEITKTFGSPIQLSGNALGIQIRGSHAWIAENTAVARKIDLEVSSRSPYHVMPR